MFFLRSRTLGRGKKQRVDKGTLNWMREFSFRVDPVLMNIMNDLFRLRFEELLSFGGRELNVPLHSDSRCAFDDIIRAEDLSVWWWEGGS